MLKQLEVGIHFSYRRIIQFEFKDSMLNDAIKKSFDALCYCFPILFYGCLCKILS